MCGARQDLINYLSPETRSCFVNAKIREDLSDSRLDFPEFHASAWDAKRIKAVLRGVTCFDLNFTAILRYWHNAVRAAWLWIRRARPCDNAPSARQKRQETTVSPACALFRFPRLADATGWIDWPADHMAQKMLAERHVQCLSRERIQIIAFYLILLTHFTCFG